jgi:hypothetical protein
MIEQHTPGPWLLNDKAGYESVLADNGFMVADCMVFGFTSRNARTEEINRANARLISAAPDLLMLAYQYVADLKYPPTGDSIARRIAAAKVVIAKAGASA